MAFSDLSETLNYVDFFRQRLQTLLTHWRDHPAVQQVQVAVLDREREVILKAISLGLDVAPLWPLVRPLVIAFTPYMERRGHWEAWHTVLQRAIAVAQKLADRDAETTLTALLARLSQRMSRPKDVVTYYHRTIRLARQMGNRYEEARACSNLGYLYIDAGRWWRSEVLSQHALAIFEEQGSEHGRAHTHNHLGLLFVRMRDWPAAETHLLTACKLWTTIQDQHSLIYGYENLALLYNEMHEPEKALVYLEKTEELIRHTGENSEIATIWSNMALAYRLSGNLDKAIIFAKKAAELYRQRMNLLALARVWHNLSLIYLADGQVAQAEYYREEALTIYRQFKYQTGEQQLMKDYERH